MPDEAKMFKSVKMLNRKKFENPYIYDIEGKIITNPTEIQLLKIILNNILRTQTQMKLSHL